MKFFLSILTIILATTAHSATWNSDGSVSDIQSKHTSAANGDIITIPTGTFTWTNTLNITKAITLQGGGVGNSIILDAVTNGAAQKLMVWNLVQSNASRMTGIEFRNGGRGADLPYIIEIYGDNTNGSSMRVDHNKFEHLRGFDLVPNDVIGVIDNNVFLKTNGIPIYAFHKNWNGVSTVSGGSWADESHFGTDKFLFVEDNTFTGLDSMAAFDCYGGARIVFRHNTCFKTSLEVHGTESSQIYRGGRAFEIYNNSFDGPTSGDYILNGRSGIFVVTRNLITNNASAKLALVYYRAQYPFQPWGAMAGTNVWDVNEEGGPFLSETADSGTESGGALGYPTVTVTGAGWTVNEWRGYSIVKTSAEDSTQKSSYVYANTSDTITFVSAWTGASMALTNGTTFQLWKVNHALDQPGRARGTLIEPTDPPVPPEGWNDQVTELCYSWNNTNAAGGGLSFDAGAYVDLIRNGEHFTNGVAKSGWTAYTYPHPLTGEVAEQPSPGNRKLKIKRQ